MLQSSARDVVPKPTKAFMNKNPGYDRSKPYQVVAFGQPKKQKDRKTGKEFIRHTAVHHASLTSKRQSIRVARAMVKRPEVSHADVYGGDTTLIYQCHYNQKDKRIIAEEL